ncbi:MAG: hypothetical protein AVDCRST_MAG02-56, partial [uncultured Rubrobacteraceae bacterium]
EVRCGLLQRLRGGARTGGVPGAGAPDAARRGACGREGRAARRGRARAVEAARRRRARGPGGRGRRGGHGCHVPGGNRRPARRGRDRRREPRALGDLGAPLGGRAEHQGEGGGLDLGPGQPRRPPGGRGGRAARPEGEPAAGGGARRDAPGEAGSGENAGRAPRAAGAGLEEVAGRRV